MKILIFLYLITIITSNLGTYEPAFEQKYQVKHIKDGDKKTFPSKGDEGVRVVEAKEAWLEVSVGTETESAPAIWHPVSIEMAKIRPVVLYKNVFFIKICPFSKLLLVYIMFVSR